MDKQKNAKLRMILGVVFLTTFCVLTSMIIALLIFYGIYKTAYPATIKLIIGLSTAFLLATISAVLFYMDSRKNWHELRTFARLFVSKKDKP